MNYFVFLIRLLLIRVNNLKCSSTLDKNQFTSMHRQSPDWQIYIYLVFSFVNPHNNSRATLTNKLVIENQFTSTFNPNSKLKIKKKKSNQISNYRISRKNKIY